MKQNEKIEVSYKATWVLIALSIVLSAFALGSDAHATNKDKFDNGHDNRVVKHDKPSKPTHPGKPASPSASSTAQAAAGAVGVGVGIGVGLGGNGGSGGAATASSAGGSATGGTSVANVGPMNFSFTSNAASIPANQRIETTGKVTVRQAPAIAHQLGSPTANCLNVIGAGGSGSAGAGLLSFGYNVDWCMKAELSRQARNHGMEKTADDLFCNIEEVKALNTPECAESRERAKANAGEQRGSQAPNPAFNSN